MENSVKCKKEAPVLLLPVVGPRSGDIGSPDTITGMFKLNYITQGALWEDAVCMRQESTRGLEEVVSHKRNSQYSQV